MERHSNRTGNGRDSAAAAAGINTGQKAEGIRKKMDNQSNSELNQNVKSAQDALAAIGCDPTWDIFMDTYSWFVMKKNMSFMEQDRYHEAWIYLYGKRIGNKKPPKRSCRNSGGHHLANKGGSPGSQVSDKNVLFAS